MVRTARFVCALFLFGFFVANAAPQAPFVKTTYPVAPAKSDLWVTWHEPLSDQEIARVNLELFGKGNKKAAWELGLAYMQGLGIEQDFAKAEKMFRIGAVDADEKGTVGMFYAHGYFPRDLDAVERWYSAAGRPQDYFEMAETFKAAAQDDPSLARKIYPRATAVYLELLQDPSQAESRRAQLVLGNFVIDRIYSAGNDEKGRAQNLAWARMIAQELLGQKEYGMAVEYEIGSEDLPADREMALRYLKRAAAYNIDLAQHAYVEALNGGTAKDFSGYDYVAWARLASGKQAANVPILKAFMKDLSEEQRRGADAAYRSLLQTRELYGAYYTVDDPLRDPSAADLEAMRQDDPDVMLREAFSMEKRAARDERDYERALAIYRDVRNNRDTAARFVLGRYALEGRNGVPRNLGVAEYWIGEAARSGSKPAQAMLDELLKQPQ